MGGQRRTCAVMALSSALVLSALLSGCSANAGSSPEELCSLPATGTLVRDEGGGYVYTYANGTQARLAFANGACVPFVSAFAFPREERSEWELGFTYDYYITELGPCLNGFGFPILAPPDRTDFISRGGDWSPYDVVHTGMVDGSTLAQLSRVCPALPPGVR